MSDTNDIGSIASNVTSNTGDAAKAVTAGADAAGVVDTVASVEKFKIQQGNPTENPNRTE